MELNWSNIYLPIITIFYQRKRERKDHTLILHNGDEEEMCWWRWNLQKCKIWCKKMSECDWECVKLCLGGWVNARILRKRERRCRREREKIWKWDLEGTFGSFYFFGSATQHRHFWKALHQKIWCVIIVHQI